MSNSSVKFKKAAGNGGSGRDATLARTVSRESDQEEQEFPGRHRGGPEKGRPDQP
jgi:hypothetical protein